MDKRESILARLREIGEGVSGIVKAARNEGAIDEDDRPAIIVLDADEQSDEGDRGDGRSFRVALSPQIFILLSGKPEDVGSQLNAFRAKLLAAIFSDATLRALVGINGGIRYEGCATGLATGRSMEGEMGLNLSFHYILKPADLINP